MQHQSRLRKIALCAAVAAALGAGASAHALVFNLTPTGNAAADLGFQRAAQFWQGIFSDNVTVNITSGFAPLAPGILGQAGSTFVGSNLVQLRGALAADATSADDATMVAGMPAGNSYSKYINRTLNNPNGAGSAVPYVQRDITALQMTTANAKALGLVAGNAAGEDAEITFSSNFAFDFDPSDGIGAGLIDFVGVAIHELGHAMGFISGVDVLDFNSPPQGGTFNDNLFDPFANPLDFTRCSAASEGAGADMDWTADQRAKSFALDGACTALIGNAWATGVRQGDGRQASHWKDNLGIGIMDPTAEPAGFAMTVTANDIRAFDVIGWTIQQNGIPEPGSLLLLGTAILGLVGASRRKAAK